MKVYVNIDKVDLELFNIFKSAFLYVNTQHEYIFEEPKFYDCRINASLDYFPIKSIESELKKGKEITLTPESEYVYTEGNLFKSNSDKSFLWFKYPIKELLSTIEITSDKAKYIADLHYLIIFGSIAKVSKDFINSCLEKIQLILSNKSLKFKLPFTYSEVVTAKQYGIDLIYKSLSTLKEPEDRSLINKNICFACVTSIEYTEPTYVFLHSMFKFNAIKVFKVYFVNGSEEEVNKFQDRCSKISPNIEVIQYNYHTEATTILHFNRNYVDSKMSILDTLTPKYDLTVMCDCDMLCQGNLKNTLIFTLFKSKLIYGVKDILALYTKVFNKSLCYINGGFIIYKRGQYDFEKRYSHWKCSDLPESKGMYNEQDFINYVYATQIQELSAINNYTAHHKKIENSAPIIYHYPGPTKPFQNVENETCNTVFKVVTGLFTPYIPETMYHELYRNYVNTISTELDHIFLKQINYIKESSIIKKYDNLVCQKCISIINEED